LTRGLLAAIVAIAVVVGPVAPDRENRAGTRPRDPEALTGPARLDVGPSMPKVDARQSQPQVSQQKAKTEGGAAVATALSYRGVRYRYAGMTSRGMDCSGLISRVLMAHGLRAPHSSRALFNLGRAVRYNELRQGDLLFFTTRRRGISHVGMYVGDGKFVHSSTGRGVVISSLSEGYYAKRMVGARRVF